MIIRNYFLIKFFKKELRDLKFFFCKKWSYHYHLKIGFWNSKKTLSDKLFPVVKPIWCNFGLLKWHTLYLPNSFPSF